MPYLLPLKGKRANQEIETTIDGFNVALHLHWNARDNADKGAWYVDVYDEDENLIAGSLKIVLGAFIGRGVDHPLFRNGVIVAVDTARKRNNDVPREANYFDLGTRVRVYYYTEHELACLANQLYYETGL